MRPIKAFKRRHYALLGLICLVSVGCGPARLEPPIATPTEIITPLPSVIPQATFTPAPLPTLTLTPRPTEPEPPSTPASSTQARDDSDRGLRIRTPSLAQVQDYLESLEPSDFVELEPDAELIYGDIDGDKEKDLIVHSYLTVYLFLWKESAYTLPFLFAEPRDHYGANLKVALRDWTADDTPEVSLEYLGWNGGPGVKSHRWAQTIIHCTAAECRVVWQNITTLLITTDDIAFQGMNLFLNKPVLLQAKGENPQIVQRSQAFAFNTYNWFNYSLPEPIPTPRCNLYSCMASILPSVRSVYRWTGTTFEVISKTVESSPPSFPGFLPRAVNNSTVAEVVPRLDNYSFANEKCQLTVEGRIVSGLFDCNPNYAEVVWQDVTGDKQPEIVVKMVSGPKNFDGDWITDKECTHERLVVYRWDGRHAYEIANVIGCVVQEDLFGVRLEDVNEDGNPEIIAADKWLREEVCEQSMVCWEEFNEIDEVYRWDGSKFVFWRKVPRET